VRRVFCVLLKKGRVLEWSRAVDGWATMPETSSIQDPCLVRPLPVAALLDAARADDEMGEALLVKRPPSIRRALSESEGKGVKKGRREGEKKGRLVGARNAVRRVLARRDLPVDAQDAARIDACTDLATLERWLDQAVAAASTTEALL
jgi:hypothetical protein